MMEDPISGDVKPLVDDCINKLMHNRINERLKELAAEMNEPTADRAALLKEHAALIQKLKKFK